MLQWLLIALFAQTTSVPYERGHVVERLAAAADPAMTYAYYLPSGYTAEKRWPVLFVFDPGKRGPRAAELFRDAAETYGWIIVSSNDTDSSADWPPNARAINAMTRDARQRFSLDRSRVYAAGMSGGAIMAWTLGQSSGSLAGVIGCSGRLSDNQTAAVTFDWFGTAGTGDFNYGETRAVESALAAAHKQYRVEIFDGGHEWPPKELATQAIEWMELQAMRRGTRARDDAFIARTLHDDLAAAAALEQSGHDLDALRRYDAIARTYETLADVAPARAKADALRDRAAVRRALRDQKHAAEFESAAKQRMSRAIQSFIADDAQPAAVLARELDIQHLRKLASRNNDDAFAARRILGITRYQLRMLAYDLDQHQRGTRAQAVRSVIAMLQP